MASVGPELAFEALREALKRSRIAIEAKQAPDSKDTEETVAAKEAKAKIRAIEEDNEDKSSFRTLREKYATWVYGYLVGYSLICGAIIFLAGFGVCNFFLPESVLGFLVGSTAVSAIGLVLAVTLGLFKR